MAMMQHQHMGQHSSMRRVAPAPTGPDTRATSEQYPEVDFLTLVGSLHALEIVIEQWAPLVGAANFQSTTLPRILALPSATQEYASQALRVAVVRHEANLGPTLVTRLRTQLNLFQIADVVVEEGYFLSSAGPPSGNHDQLDMVDSWSVRWETRHLDALCRRFEVPLVPDLLGAAFTGRWEFPRKAVLIDTGDEGAATQTGFDIELTAVERPSDHHGHGTSVGSLMRMTAPQAEVHSYRVMRRGDNFVESSVLLNAITSATMMIGEYHIVVIPQRANLSVQKRGQCDAIHRVVRQNAARSYPTPVVVCAAGNAGPRERMDYPATVPGVVIAVALDWSRQVANYNCSIPIGPPVFTIGAAGGIEKYPLGNMTKNGQPAKDLYGSSYAAALVGGALASHQPAAS